MSTMIDPFLNSLDSATAGDAPGWLADLRQRGRDGYAAHGLPSAKLESWKYTNLNPLRKIDFAAAGGTVVPGGITLPFADLDAHRLVLVNGRFAPELSDLEGLGDGVSVTSLSEALTQGGDGLQALLDAPQGDASNALTALNAAHLDDGAVIRIKRGKEAGRLIHLVHLSVGGEDARAFHPRTAILLEDGARADIVESHSGQGGATMSNLVTRVQLGRDAHLGHYKLQNESAEAYHIAQTAVSVGQGAEYDGFVLHLGGRMARNEVNIEILGGNAEARINGAYHADGEMHVDNTTFIDHIAAESRSREHFKGVLDDNARGVFQGRILVRRDAQQTDGQQMNKALLLSRGAEIDSKPELEIYADDVKCSHGATAGELDEHQLFYLRARGIDEESARAMLVQAFLYEALDEIRSDAVKDAFHAAIAAKLGDVA